MLPEAPINQSGKESFMDPAQNEVHAASEQAFGPVFEEGVRMYALMLWQAASARQRRKYPRYALPRKEYERVWHDYQERVADNHAISLDTIVAVIKDAISVYEADPLENIDVRVAGENLKAVSMFLCCLGEEPCPGDVAFFLETTWDIQSTHEERRRIRSFDGRKELLMLLNVLLAQASREISALGRERGVSSLRYYTFDEDQNFSLDHGVLNTNYLAICALTQFVEREVGHA